MPALTFRSQQEEEQFDEAANTWLQQHRFVENTHDLSKILELAHSYNSPICPTSFERAYRELCASGDVTICNDKFIAPLARQPLTAEEYGRMAANDIIRKYHSDSVFQAEVESLISQGKI